jgi:hypothetical protein
MKVGTLDSRAFLEKASRLAEEAPRKGDKAREEQARKAPHPELSRMALFMNALWDLEVREPRKYRLAMGAIKSRLGAAACDPGNSAELFLALSRKFGEAGGAATTAGSTAEGAAARADRRAAAEAPPRQLEEILQSALAEVGA